MLKTTVYLPESLDARLAVEARESGRSKAQLIREAVEKLLAESGRSGELPPLPVFESGRPMTVEEMDEAIYLQIKERASRR